MDLESSNCVGDSSLFRTNAFALVCCGLSPRLPRRQRRELTALRPSTRWLSHHKWKHRSCSCILLRQSGGSPIDKQKAKWPSIERDAPASSGLSQQRSNHLPVSSASPPSVGGVCLCALQNTHRLGRPRCLENPRPKGGSLFTTPRHTVSTHRHRAFAVWLRLARQNGSLPRRRSHARLRRSRRGRRARLRASSRPSSGSRGRGVVVDRGQDRDALGESAGRATPASLMRRGPAAKVPAMSPMPGGSQVAVLSPGAGTR
jgi:hypothetical protein